MEVSGHSKVFTKETLYWFNSNYAFPEGHTRNSMSFLMQKKIQKGENHEERKVSDNIPEVNGNLSVKGKQTFVIICHLGI